MTEALPTLCGTKVFLSRLRREDIPELARYFQNLELTTYLRGFGQAYSLEDEQAFFESVSKISDTEINFGIYEQGTGRLIGGTNLFAIHHRHGTAELGISIHDPACWGSGYGSEAAQLMVQYGMFHQGLHNIMLRVFAFNTRAIRAYEKIGFSEIGRRSGAIRLGQERFDEVYMQILADDVDTSALRGQIGLLPSQVG